MRPITGTDIIDFYNTRYGLLVLTADGEFDHLDGEGSAYDFVTIDDTEVQVLLERSTVEDGGWFPDALTEDGNLIPAVADEMAHIINNDGILPSRARKAIQAGEDWKKDEETAQQSAARRAAAVAEVVAYSGGNQSAAARTLGLDQSTVNKLVAKYRRSNVHAYEDNAGQIFLQRGDVNHYWYLGVVTHDLRGRFTEHAEAWTNGDWEPNEEDGQTRYDGEPHEGLVRIGSWNAAEGMRVARRNGSVEADGGGQLYLGVNEEGRVITV